MIDPDERARQRLEAGDVATDPLTGDYLSYAMSALTGRLIVAIVRLGGRSKQLPLPRAEVRRLRDFCNDYLENTP